MVRLPSSKKYNSFIYKGFFPLVFYFKKSQFLKTEVSRSETLKLILCHKCIKNVFKFLMGITTYTEHFGFEFKRFFRLYSGVFNLITNHNVLSYFSMRFTL